GDIIRSQGRTIHQSDIVNFAGFTGDYSEIHVDEEFCKDTPFGKPIAHGMLGLSVATGLAILTGVLEGTIIAFTGIKNWEFKRPVFPGDTIYVELKVISKEEAKLKGNIKAGTVTVEASVLKGGGKGKICQSGQFDFLVKFKDS
ncbi:MAG: MaoC family dehydratase N-terminal domain-containing protein, partial [Leptospiraceae bacterium]|nr:MaoC family dehydratase N-terminal domain-containing protein [Leptospiraceae bacterium]